MEALHDRAADVRIDDILVHPRDNDSIVGTHGRSIWIIDDISPLQQLTDAVTTTDAHLFDIRPAIRWVEDTMLAPARRREVLSHAESAWRHRDQLLQSQASAASSGGTNSKTVPVTISDMRRTSFAAHRDKQPGINRVQWNLARQAATLGRGGFGAGRGRGGGPQLIVNNAVQPGTYIVKLIAGDKELTRMVLVEADSLGNS